MGELRLIRIGQILKERISEILIRKLRDDIAFTTITDVKVAPDLRNATVYYSVIGTEEEKKKTEESLHKARGFINYEVGKGLEIRYTPVLRFEYDNTEEKASRVFELLNKIEEEKLEHSEKIQKPARRPKKRSKKSKK